MNKILAVGILLSVYAKSAFACSPIMPTLVPPITRDGEFTIVQPISEKDAFIESLSKASDIAIASLYLDYRDPNTKNSQTELRVLRGWGKPRGELVKFIRKASNCGEPEQLKEGGWYVVVYSPYGNPTLMRYDLVKEQIDKLGPTTYAYTPIGLLPK